mgnify:CR=1 FL=1
MTQHIPLVLVCALLSIGARGDLLHADADWRSRTFAGETRYTWHKDDEGEYVCGNAAGTASARLRAVSVDLAETPLLRWRWRAPHTRPDLPQRTRSGDDFPARVYVVSRAGFRVRTLAFVWAHAPESAPWPNPFDPDTVVIPLRHGDEPGWQSESVNLVEALAAHFDIESPSQLGVGFMTDGDNSGSTLSGCYRDLGFHAAD